MPDGSHKGQAATHSTAEAPSAPPIVEDERQTVSNPAVGSAVYPDVAHIAHDGPQAQGRSEQVVPPYNEPPPAYHTVVNYPPYPSGSIPHGPPPCVPHYMPKPNPVPAYGTGPARPPPPAQITQVITVGIASVCPHCNVGVLQKETDMCCLLCLILLTIFTFPFGLIFICCIPWTVIRRCPNCHRIVRNA